MESKKGIQPYILLLAFVFYFSTMISKSIYDVLSPYTDYVLYIAVILCIFFSQYVYAKDVKNHLKYFSFFLAYGIFSILNTNGGIGSLLGFAFVPLYVCGLEKIVFTRKAKRSFLILFVGFILVLSVTASYITNNYSWTKNNFISPNTYGLTCSFCFMYAYIFMLGLEFRHKKLFTWLLFALTIYVNYELDCRTAMYTSLLFFFAISFVPSIFLKKRFLMTVIIVLLILPFVFPIIYVNFYTSGVDLKLPFTDKSLYTGRELIWSMFFSHMGSNLKNWLIGVGSKVPIYVDTGRSQSQHLHNNTLALLTIFGIIGTLMTYSYLLKNIKRIMSRYPEGNKKLVTCLIVFICFIFEGFTENTMVGVSLFPLLCLGLLLDNEGEL